MLRFLSPGVVIALCACSYPDDPTVIERHVDGTFGAATIQEEPAGDAVAAPFLGDFTSPNEVRVDYDLDRQPDESFSYALTNEGSLLVDGIRVAQVSIDGQFAIGGNLDVSDPHAGLTLGAGARMTRGTGSSLFNGRYLFCTLGKEASTGSYFTRLESGIAGGDELLLTTGILADSRGRTGSRQRSFFILDGEIQMESYIGAMSFDGAHVVLSLPGLPGRELVVGIKRRSSVTVADFLGHYSGFSFVHAAGVSRTSQVSLDADGAGRVVWSESRSDGTTSSEALGYAFETNSVLALGAGEWVGCLGNRGSVLALVDADPTDGSIGMLLAVSE